MESPKFKLDLTKFRDLNAQRAVEGFKCYKNVPLTYWTTALMGEGGELCNMIKKMERIANGGIDGGSSYTAADITTEMLEEEIGGIAIYLDLLAGLLNISLEDAIIKTFNSKSEKYNFKQYITIMSNLQIDKDKAAAVYSKADENGKKLLEQLFDKNTFWKITDRIKTYDDACSFLGIGSELVLPNDLKKSVNAYEKLCVIAQALNEGWTPDWTNEDEYKWYPWWEMKGASGFCLSDVLYDCSISNVGSRLCFRSRELAEYAATQFKELYREMMVM